MKLRMIAGLALASALLMGAKGCSDCEKKQAAAVAVCQASGEESEVCKQAKALAEEACKPEPQPTPTPTPTPTPEPTPTPTPTPTPPPTPACAVEEDLVAISCGGGPQLQDKVVAAMQALGDPTGLPVAQTLERLAAKLREGGLCAFAGIEAVFVKRTDGRFEEYHAVFFGNGGWTHNGKFIGCHRAASDPVGTTCPAEPCPQRLNADGTPRWRWNAKQHTMGNADSTPVVIADWDYCKAVGLGWLDAEQTIPRGTCPMRPDGHPDRYAVEEWLLEGGPVRDSRNGEDCAPNNTDNPMAFRFGTGNCRICNSPKTVCSAWL